MDNCSDHCFSAHYKSKPRGRPVCAVHGCVYSALCHHCVVSLPLHAIPVITQHSPGSTRAAAKELSSQMDEILNSLQLLLCQAALVKVDWPCCELLWAAVSQLRQSCVCCCYNILAQKLTHGKGLKFAERGRWAGRKDQCRLSSD